MARDGKLVRYIDSKALRDMLESIFIRKDKELQLPTLNFKKRRGER